MSRAVRRYRTAFPGGGAGRGARSFVVGEQPLPLMPPAEGGFSIGARVGTAAPQEHLDRHSGTVGAPLPRDPIRLGRPPSAAAAHRTLRTIEQRLEV